MQWIGRYWRAQRSRKQGSRLGEKELQKWRDEYKLEMEKESTIEERIRQRKKEKAKRSAEAGRRMEPGQPKRKKMRMEEGEEAGRVEEPRERGKKQEEHPSEIINKEESDERRKAQRRAEKTQI